MLLGLLITVILSYVLERRTHDHAINENLVGDPDKDPKSLGDLQTLDNLIRWRELTTAFFTGIFVLQFSAAQKISSKYKIFASMDMTVADIAQSITVVLPWILLIGFVFADKLRLFYVQSSARYRIIFLSTVLPWYLISAVFVYAPD